MVNASGKVDLGWLEGVVSGEVNLEEEDATGVWAVRRPHNGGLPVEHVLVGRASRARGRWVTSEVLQLL